MSRAIRSVSTEHGYDLSTFALFAFGGAGPLHAMDVASECGIPVVVIPQEPGTMCAGGMLLTDVFFDFVAIDIAVVDGQSWTRVRGKFASLEAGYPGRGERARCVCCPDRGRHRRVAEGLGGREDHSQVMSRAIARFRSGSRT